MYESRNLCDRLSLTCGAASQQLWPMQYSSLAALSWRPVSSKQVLGLLLTLADLTLADLTLADLTQALLGCIPCRLPVCSQC